MIFAASMVSARALQPLDQIVGSWKQISDASAAWARITAHLRTVETAPAGQTGLPTPTGAVDVQNVVYFLPGGRKGAPALIKRVNFSMHPGETLAVIGPSRAGKSTLARLLVGAIDPSSGTVRLDDVDIQTWDREKLGCHVGYLSQEVELFPGTIAQNICRFDPDASGERIVEAAERAKVDKLILGQRDAYETAIGPGGARLSGGERQSIGLARALYGDPRLIVLDEPNANLDSEGETALEQTIMEAKARGASVVIITHRPSIAAKCDRVMVLRDGQVDQFGPAADVFRRLAAAPVHRPSAEVVPMASARAAAGSEG